MQKKGTESLRASEARQPFLVGLEDALRPLTDAIEIQAEASRLLGEHLGVNRVTYAEIDGPDVVIQRGYANGVGPLTGRFRHSAFGDTTLVQSGGEPVAVADIARDPRFTDAQRASLRAADVAATVSVALIKGGRWVAAFGMHSAVPRRWTAADVELTREVAERTCAAVERARAEAAVRVSEERFRRLFDTMDQTFAIAELVRDDSGRVVDIRYLQFNAVWERVNGVTRADAVGRLRSELFPGDYSWWNRIYEGVVKMGEPFRFESHDPQTDRWFDITAFPYAGDRFAALTDDITAQKRAQDELQASEARYRMLVENVRDCAIFLLDVNGVVTEWTTGAQRLKGYTPEEVVGTHFSRFYTPEDVADGAPERVLAEAVATGRAEREAWRVRQDGTRFWADEIVTAIRGQNGRLIGFTKISRDLTERRAAQEAAEQTRAMLDRETLRRQLALAEEAERRRISRELHDQLGQHLTAFALGLAETRRLVAAAESPDARLSQLEELAARMTRDARYLALELRPPELDDVGLESALETYVAQWSARYNVTAEVVITGAAAHVPMPADAGTVIYRIAQEALTNVAKHAEAQHVTVLVDKTDGQARLVVEDDGKGFDLVATAERAKSAHRLGVAGMLERATLVGGTLELESSEGAGTTVYVRVPFGTLHG